jgi:hypothetical protein
MNSVKSSKDRYGSKLPKIRGASFFEKNFGVIANSRMAAEPSSNQNS